MHTDTFEKSQFRTSAFVLYEYSDLEVKTEHESTKEHVFKNEIARSPAIQRSSLILLQAIVNIYHKEYTVQSVIHIIYGGNRAMINLEQ
jgi:hypothetical protein